MRRVFALCFLLFLGCGSDVATHHELLYTVNQGAVREISKDAVLHEQDVTRIVLGPDTLVYKGNFLRVLSVTSMKADKPSTDLEYSLTTSHDSLLSRIRITDIERAPFGSIVLTGDISEIPRDFFSAAVLIHDLAENDLAKLTEKGEKRVINTTSGEDVE